MKTYISILYFNTGLNERINVGLIMFNDLYCMVDLKPTKMKFVKLFKPVPFKLFDLTIKSFVKYYNQKLPTYSEIKRLSIYNNNIFKIDCPNVIDIEFTSENFYKYLENC